MEEIIYLQLEDGTCFRGRHFGAPLTKDIVAEVVFTTAMTGYVETLTDPSYYGQMVVQTFPMIGNYGVNTHDFESQGIHLSAYITREYCEKPSNFRSQMDLNTLLIKQNIPGIYDIDTRALTKKIRQSGVMNGVLTQNPLTPDVLSSLKDFKVTDAVKNVSCTETYCIASGIEKYHVVLWDFGAKQNIIRKLHALDCKITVVPSTATCEEICALKPDGIMLSNGPGNPEENKGVITELSKLCKRQLPVFGICLGHQLLALANGAQTEKLKYGHRGSNQPVKDLLSGKVFITSQNHGYAVKTNALPKNSTLSFINVNDETCEGLTYETFPGFSVQFHPEACGGPHDTEYLFHQFIHLMEERKQLCH